MGRGGVGAAAAYPTAHHGHPARRSAQRRHAARAGLQLGPGRATAKRGRTGKGEARGEGTLFSPRPCQQRKPAGEHCRPRALHVHPTRLTLSLRPCVRLCAGRRKSNKVRGSGSLYGPFRQIEGRFFKKKLGNGVVGTLVARRIHVFLSHQRL